MREIYECQSERFKCKVDSLRILRVMHMTVLLAESERMKKSVDESDKLGENRSM